MKLDNLQLNIDDMARECTRARSDYVSDRTIAEGGRVRSFSYGNYGRDPRPKVFVLGRWHNPKTGKDIIGGLNVHYMDRGEIMRLREIVPLILKAGNLKDRYRLGKKLLPDIFNEYYRTYDKKYITNVTPGKISKVTKDLEDKPEETPDKLPDKLPGEKPSKKPGEKPDLAKDIDRALDKDIISKPDEPDHGELDRDELTIQKVINAVKKNKPDRAATPRIDPHADEPEDVDILDVNAPMDLDIPDELLAPTDGPDAPAGPPVPVDQEHGLDKGTKTESTARNRWVSYRRSHQPARYLSERRAQPPWNGDTMLLAVHDVMSGITLVDDVIDHAEIIHDAGWDYSHTIRLLPVRTNQGIRVIPLHDGLPDAMVRGALDMVKPLALDAMRNQR